ncbi:VWA domain-containing protein [Candidatus Gottesmanbacteria bacterium]|nr:VWA domain-containing protein [Candidatus Gottesmanbacteria bacterium]
MAIFNKKNLFKFSSRISASTIRQLSLLSIAVILLNVVIITFLIKKLQDTAPSPTFQDTPSRAQTQCSDQIDLVNIDDGSGSIVEPDFELSRQFSIEMVKNLDIKANGIYMAQFEIGTAPLNNYLIHELTDDKNILIQSIQDMPKFGGSTPMHEVIQAAHEHLKAKGRSDSPKAMILKTDGEPENDDYTLKAAYAAKIDKIVIIAIAIGGADEEFLKRLVTEDKYLLRAASYGKLSTILSELLKTICDVPPPDEVPTPPPPVSSPFLQPSHTPKPTSQPSPTPSLSPLPSPSVIPSPSPYVPQECSICRSVQGGDSDYTDPGTLRGKCCACYLKNNSVWTGIGCVPSRPHDFLLSLVKFSISIAGGIAFLLILYAGFMLMTSQGNPEKIQSGKELLYAAITGLLLIVFSIIILKIIGVDILGIPGLG